MKRLTSALITLSFVATIPTAVAAQQRPASPERSTWSDSQGLHETGDIIGTKVQGPDGKDIGKIDALLIEPKGGKVSHAVISVGGMLGIGDERVVVPYASLRIRGHEGGKRGTIAVDQATLDKAPKYVKASERQPSASPATRRDPAMSTSAPNVTGTTPGTSLSGDPRKDTPRDADGRQVPDQPKDSKGPANEKK
ncbi:MAG: PRC-barrel domain-containing protein [Candidatus Rokubacteria bacterium]|nr:PRC-barrel domain-containing protein [Candidatus Rokubacteria bacterium]